MLPNDIHWKKCIIGVSSAITASFGASLIAGSDHKQMITNAGAATFIFLAAFFSDWKKELG